LASTPQKQAILTHYPEYKKMPQRYLPIMLLRIFFTRGRENRSMFIILTAV
jgi:hypothetical protein